MLQKLRTVIYHVHDLAAAKEWYTALTGMQPYFDEAFYIGFDINGFELGLDPDMSQVKQGNQAVSYWAVENIQAAVQKAVELKALVISPITNVGGTIEVATILDPFGNQLGFITGA